MKILLKTLILVILLTTSLHYQETKLELPTNGRFKITGTNVNRNMKFSADGGFYLSGDANAATIPITGAGTRLMWYPSKAAFRAGYVISTQWDDINIGQYSTAMGSWASTNSHLGAFVIGDKSTSAFVYVLAEQDNQMLMRFKGGYKLYTNAQMDKGVLMNQGDNSWSSISDSTKKTNFLDPDGEYFLNSVSKLKLGSWNYKNQNPETFRHYGPMAQEIYHYFGKDEYGTIGNDTTIATADMDGIMMICLQELENRTRNNAEMIMQNAEFKKENVEIRNEIAEIEKALQEQNNKVTSQQNTIEEMAIKLAAIEVKLNAPENDETILSSNNSAERNSEVVK